MKFVKIKDGHYVNVDHIVEIKILSNSFYQKYDISYLTILGEIDYFPEFYLTIEEANLALEKFMNDNLINQNFDKLCDTIEGLTTEIYKYRRDLASKNENDTTIWT